MVDLAGIRIPRVSMPFMFMPDVPCFLGARRALWLLRAARLPPDLALRFDFRVAFGFDMSMPDMPCMLLPWCRAHAAAVPSATSAEMRISAYRRARIGFRLLMTPPKTFRDAGDKTGRDDPRNLRVRLAGTIQLP